MSRHLPADAIWVVSHLRRTHQTAAAIGRAGYDLPELRIEPGFGEQNLGALHGRKHVEHTSLRSDPYEGFWPIHPEETPPGGESWVDVTPGDLGGAQINAIEVSPHDAGTVYIAVTGYKLNDFQPYIYKGTDYGQHWQRLDEGRRDDPLPAVVAVN